jgi:hypothetical protein
MAIERGGGRRGRVKEYKTMTTVCEFKFVRGLGRGK